MEGYTRAACVYPKPLPNRVSGYCGPLAELFFKHYSGQVFRGHLHTKHNNNCTVALLTVTRIHTPTPVAPALLSVGHMNGEPDSHTLVN